MSDLIERLREAGESAARIACRSVDPQPGLDASLVNEAADALTTANETIARLEREKEQAFQMLEAEGVSRERARSVANGIDVLATRARREATMLNGALATKEAELLACRADKPDAERYRWLKDSCGYGYGMGCDSPAEVGIAFHWQQSGPEESSMTIDAAIDAIKAGAQS